MIDQETINKVRERAQILDVVSEFMTLKRRGQNYVGLCPFHNEKTPSFSVSPARNYCKCFSCGKGGDPVGFIMEHEQMTFFEAIRWLAKKYNIEIEERQLTDEELERQKDREGMMQINEYANQTFITQLFDQLEGRSRALAYLYSRGLHDDIIRKFQLGYALAEAQAFSAKAIDAGFKKDYLLAMGICQEDNEAKGLPFDRFPGQITFPIYSISGKIVAFQSCQVAASENEAVTYADSPESPIFKPEKFLYGIFWAKQAIAKADRCYLVNRPFDLLSMNQVGIENVVALVGNVLSPDQIRSVRNKNFTLFSGDNISDIRLTMQNIDMLLQEGMNVRILMLPDGETPDSYARHHTAVEFKEYIANNEMDCIFFKIMQYAKLTAVNPSLQQEVIGKIAHSLSLIKDTIIQSVYVRESSRMLNISEAVMTYAIHHPPIDVNRQRNMNGQE